MITWQDAIAHFYTPNTELYRILTTHSAAVANMAMQIIDAHPELNIDRNFVFEAAMLHDIGIIKTDAPGIQCFGSARYICHGFLGREMLDSLGLTRHALVCERHTGSGITVSEMIEQDLPLPHRDMTPQTIEEQLVCYADKFYSKSKNLEARKPLEKAIKSVEKHGGNSLARFMAMHEMFKIE